VQNIHKLLRFNDKMINRCFSAKITDTSDFAKEKFKNINKNT